MTSYLNQAKYLAALHYGGNFVRAFIIALHAVQGDEDRACAMVADIAATHHTGDFPR